MKKSNEIMCNGQFRAVCPLCGCESKLFDEIHDFFDWIVANWYTLYIDNEKNIVFVCPDCAKNIN